VPLLDQLLPHKQALECHLKERPGRLFGLRTDLLLSDVTSTFFEGTATSPLVQRGSSRDQRRDCKQVCIGHAISRCGMPLGDEVFAGNTADVTTVQQMVSERTDRYGQSQRVWVMDRGMVSDRSGISKRIESCPTSRTAFRARCDGAGPFILESGSPWASPPA